MFLDELNSDQKNSFLALVTRVVLADGDVAPEEDALLGTLKEELGDGVVAPAEEMFGGTNASAFPSRRSRAIVVLELLVVAYSDDKFHPDESMVLDEICKAFEIDSDVRGEMEKWARAVAGAGRDGDPAAIAAYREQAETLIFAGN